MIQNFLQRLARFLDRPNFPWKTAVIGFHIGQFIFDNILLFRQYRVYNRPAAPKALEQEVDKETFDKSQAYGRAKCRFNFVTSTYSVIQSLAFIVYNVYPKTWSLAGVLLPKILPASWLGEIPQSILFALLLSWFSTFLNLPVDYFQHFVLEQEFGFNKMTLKLWVTDVIKGQALGIVIGVPLGAAFLSIVKATGDSFFYYLWVFTLCIQLAAATLYPILIIPLFNKLTPLEPGPLKERTEALAAKLKFPLDELQVIDGSKRSSHSNAYFTGLPWKKKIVIFDTLLESSTTSEVEAVLAHELGHWKLGHTTRMLVISQVQTFYLFSLFSVFIKNKSLYTAFGFTKEMPIIIGLMLFNEVLAPLDIPIKLALNTLTRSMEYQADDFAMGLGYRAELGASLIKLQIKNLSAMDADWIYSAFHYSHPHLVERLRAINWTRKLVEDNEDIVQSLNKQKEEKKADVASGREL